MGRRLAIVLTALSAGGTVLGTAGCNGTSSSLFCLNGSCTFKADGAATSVLDEGSPDEFSVGVDRLGAGTVRVTLNGRTATMVDRESRRFAAGTVRVDRATDDRVELSIER